MYGYRLAQDEPARGDGEEAQRGGDGECDRHDDKDEEGSVEANGQMATWAVPKVQNVPQAKQIRNQGHRKDEDTLDRNRKLIDQASSDKDAHRNRKKHRGYGNSRHIRP